MVWLLPIRHVSYVWFTPFAKHTVRQLWLFTLHYGSGLDFLHASQLGLAINRSRCTVQRLGGWESDTLSS
jgi:hypothetical protein